MDLRLGDGTADGYPAGRTRAWFAFAMTFALMLFDFIDRQVIVSLFPHLKAVWNVSDKQLGSLASIVTIAVGVFAIPVAFVADRVGRVKSIVAMAVTWSLATISCMFATAYWPLLAARAMVGVGVAGYGSVGGALIASLFPRRLRSALLGALVAAASLGAALGVLLGGMIAARFGWQAAFGVVGVPGLALALLYMLVSDYHTVEPARRRDGARPSIGAMVQQIATSLLRSRTIWGCCIGGAMQLVVVSAAASWLPSYLNRFAGMVPEAAARYAALFGLMAAVGSVFWGLVADRLSRRAARAKLVTVALLCVVSTGVLASAFIGVAPLHVVLIGGFLMTCTVGVVESVALDVAHPGIRSTGLAVVLQFQNLFGLAIGPILVGGLSDYFGLRFALGATSCAGLLAAVALWLASRSYEGDAAKS
jgi:MFS family permease